MDDFIWTLILNPVFFILFVLGYIALFIGLVVWLIRDIFFK